MLIRAFNINYDTDGKDVKLPYTMFVEVEEEDDICNEVSNKTGFCVESLQYELVDIISLKEYGRRVGCKKEFETLQEIQDYVYEHHDWTLWDYPLEELEHTEENCEATILVETDFGLRICEI